MISIHSTVKITEKGDFRSRLQKILNWAIPATRKPTTVKVGFPAGKAPGDVVTYAFWNHYGTNRSKGDVFFRDGMVGISGPTPPRPFITIALFKGRSQIRSALRAHAKAMMNGTMTMPQALPLLGLQGQNLIQSQISSNMGPPNAPITIEMKGSSGTLVDSGRMYDTVTWAVNQ